ncbi:MAG: AEC family transporter [Eubacteriales bacterium]|nr:AEC family transporter [Eubacteriales bacterium]
MFLITSKSIIQLFLLILAGILLYKLRIVKDEGLPTINGILLHAALPALLFRSFQMDILFENRSLLTEALGLSLFYQLFTLLLCFIFIRKGDDKGIERCSAAFTNNAFVAVPLLSSIFGDVGAFYASATNVISSFLIWSLIPMMLTGRTSAKEFIKQVFNDKVIVCIFALILLLLNIRVPDMIMTPIGYLANLTTPLAMISIGMVIAASDIKGLINGRVMWISFLRLIVTTFIVCFALKLFVKDNVQFVSFCVLTATPTGTLTTILAENAGINSEKASGIFLVTTIFCAVTIPLTVLIMTAV